MAKLTNKDLYRQEYKKLMRRVRYNEKTHGVVVLQSSLPKPNPKRVTKDMIKEVNKIRRSNLLMISEIPMSNTAQTVQDTRSIMPDSFSSVALDRFYKIAGKYPNSKSQDIMYSTVKGLVQSYGEETVGNMLANMTEQGILEAMVYGSNNTSYGEQWIDEFMAYLPDEPQLQQAREQLLEQQEGYNYDNDWVDIADEDTPF